MGQFLLLRGKMSSILLEIWCHSLFRSFNISFWHSNFIIALFTVNTQFCSFCLKLLESHPRWITLYCKWEKWTLKRAIAEKWFGTSDYLLIIYKVNRMVFHVVPCNSHHAKKQFVVGQKQKKHKIASFFSVDYDWRFVHFVSLRLQVPSEQFFHTDYRPLIRDSNNYVLDEQVFDLLLFYFLGETSRQISIILLWNPE